MRLLRNFSMHVFFTKPHVLPITFPTIMLESHDLTA